MSMAMALEGTEAYLRSVLQMSKDQISIQLNTEPPPMAGQWFIGIDDAGVDARATGNDAYFYEVYSIEIGIWKRPGQFPKDRREELIKVRNLYVPELETLESLERKVLTVLHKSHNWRRAVNEQFNLPVGGSGDVFSNPWRYVGRGKNEKLIAETENSNGDAWIGRRLRFTGADRLQYVESQA